MQILQGRSREIEKDMFGTTEIILIVFVVFVFIFLFIGIASWLLYKYLGSSKQNSNNTKQCPFCAESIMAEAIVCRFCNSSLGK